MGREERSRDERTKVISVAGLTVDYGDDPVLQDVDLEVVEGEIFTVLGRSGCGKTTLFRTLLGLLRPRSGRLRVAGEDISDPDDFAARNRMQRHVGVLFQASALLGSFTVAENIALPLEEYTDLPTEIIASIVDLKLDLVDLADVASRYPTELSGGMQRRAALARALALDPEILFCDEPAAGLDPVTALGIDQLVLELNDSLGMTVVMVTHELDTIRNCGGYCVMLHAEKKGVIAQGTVEELEASDDSRVKRFFQRSVAETREGGGKR